MGIIVYTVNVNKYNPMRTECCIKLPREIMMKTTVNVQSKDNAYFAWAMVAVLCPVQKSGTGILLSSLHNSIESPEH